MEQEINYEEYTDDDPNVIGIATHEGRTIVFISAPGETLNWKRLVLFPTLDKNRVLVATPYEPLIGVGDVHPDYAKNYLNDFLSDAILLAEQHFASIG
jgi:hypothetical protein